MWICKRCAESEAKRGQLGKTHASSFCTSVLLQATFPASVLSLSFGLRNLFSEFNFYTSEHNSLVLQYKEAKIKLFSHTIIKKERKKHSESQLIE